MSPARKRSRPVRPRKGNRQRAASKSERDPNAWIQTVAAPYLQGYKSVRVNDGILDGFWFCAPSLPNSARTASTNSGPLPTKGNSAGFFVGYLLQAKNFSYLNPEPPECIVFAWIQPINDTLHRRLVAAKGSLLRTTFEYIRWLTHRPPRFVLHDAEFAAMARRQSMKEWPTAKRAHLSRNFFIETLAWLVRSGLVRKLREEVS